MGETEGTPAPQSLQSDGEFPDTKQGRGRADPHVTGEEPEVQEGDAMPTVTCGGGDILGESQSLPTPV